MKKSRLLGVVCTYLSIVSLNANATTYDNFTVILGSEFIHDNGDLHTIINNLTINGQWSQNGAGSSTDMFFDGTQTLGGTGELIMSDSVNNRLLGNVSTTLTVGSDLTIRGAGKTLNLPDLINNGSILAQGVNKLLIQTSTLTNNGTLRAEGAGGLHLSGVNVTNNTYVDVNAGSSLELSSNAVINGVINVAGTGTASASQTTFDGVRLDGDMQQNNSDSNTVTNGLTLNGAWNLNATSGTTGLTFNGTQSIGGVGEIVMSDSANNRVAGNGNTLTTGVGTTIRGAGKVGLNISSIQNLGFIRAQGINNELLIQSNSLTNSGLLSAEGIKGLKITSGSFTNNGLVEIVPTSVLNRTGNYVQTDGITNVDGILNVTGLIDIQGGKLSGKGQINGELRNAGTVGPGNSPGLLSIDGVYSQSVSGILAIELGGMSAGAEYDVLDITDTANLAGTLDVDLFDLGSGLFSPTLGDTFDILFAETIVGEFDTLSLAGLGNELGWNVSYILDDFDNDIVRLSVQAVPIPSAIWLFGSGLLGLAGIARGKKKA